MGKFWSNLKSRITGRSDTSGTYHPAQWFIDCFTGGEDSATGVRVNEKSALKYTPFWAAVRIISGTIGSLPFKVYERLEDDGKKPLSSHPAYTLLHDRPNPYMGTVTFFETRMAHVLCYGNGYAEIQRNGAGRPVALWPLMPNKVKRKVDDDGVFYYEYTMPDSHTVRLEDYDILHIPGLGFDGFTGYNVVEYHKTAIAYGIAVKEFGAKFFGNDATPPGGVKFPNAMGEKEVKAFQAAWKEKFGRDRLNKDIAVLHGGGEWVKFGVDPEQAQSLEVQKWTVDDCSRIFQIPPHMLGSMEFSKFNNVEQLALDFYKTTMLYWFRKWEQEVNYKLFMPSERGKYFAEILVEALLRADIKTRTEALAYQKDRGVLSVNEWRKIENRNPVPGGDEMSPAANIMGNKSNSEGSEPAADSEPNKNDNIKSAHRTLLASQWIRIIERSNSDTKKNRETAFTLLKDSVIAFASVIKKQETAIDILNNLLNSEITDNKKLTVYDAMRLADLTIDRIGGENA